MVAHHGHPAKTDEMRAQEARSDLAMRVSSIEDVPNSIGAVFDAALRAMYLSFWADRDAEYFATCESAAIALQVGSAIFEVTGDNVDAVKLFILDENRTLPMIGARTFASASNWLNTFYLAVICRDQVRMTKLCEIPVDRLRATSREDEFIYLWVDVLQTFWLRGDGLASRVQSAMEASYADAVHFVSAGYLQTILYPPVHLFYSLIFKDVSLFNEALKDALELHKVYWTSDIDRFDDATGAIALAPLAMACIGYDMEVAVEVESDYIPRHMLKGDWLEGFRF
ncbi:immunity 49 family protein [Nocardia sp. MDA0666]|uniref:immunity 49 family protein n=1 Tax=Nocardia sp. MDA0666 TaxID=2135448 RepID=UPI001E6342FF|nr:immunity 49 family protein [Nocardia sp. MDA0666]